MSLASVAASAQSSVPANQVSIHPDAAATASILKPPAGAKVAILEWEDLECPACSRAFPIVHEAVAHYKIPLVERDFPLQMHIWSKEAALYARYLKHKDPAAEQEYRRQVFASQFRINSKDDLERFTQTFFSAHGQQMPFVIDPSGQLQKEIDADFHLGEKIGINETPTIVVVTNHGWIQVKDVMQLYSAIDEAMAATAKDGPAAGKPATKKPATTAKK